MCVVTRDIPDSLKYPGNAGAVPGKSVAVLDIPQPRQG